MIRKTALAFGLWLICLGGIQSASADDLHGYLALGDSLAFGYSPLVVPVKLNKYHGYSQIVADTLDFKLSNASCFGETAQHFLDLAAPDLGCAAWRATYPLFVSYNGTQMAYALQFLQSHPKTDLVTIDIGINDLGVLLASCATDPHCADHLPDVLLAYQANLATILGQIRGTGYNGPIVAVTAYAFNYTDPVVTQAIGGLDAYLTGVTTFFGGTVADAFSAFGAAASTFSGDVCKTGLLVKLPDGSCDTHPSAQGQALIANLILNVLPHNGKGGQNQHGNDQQ